jgi:undecaprenyl-diphosphatase
MTLLQAVILGIVEGVTEFLPISSTGHLILASKLLGLSRSEFLSTFEISIQLGAILSVVVLYWRKLFVDVEVMKRVAVAFVPTAVIGFIFYKLIKKFMLSGEHTVILWSLFLGGVVLIVFELFHKEKESHAGDVKDISYAKAALIGTIQSLAMIPGVSRSGATVIGGLALGLKRKTIVEFSFLLAVPTMLAATTLDLVKNGASFDSSQLGALAVGGAVSFVIAVLSIKFFLAYVKNRSFILFGVYRIVAAALFWLFIH